MLRLTGVIFRPINRFLKLQAASSILLLSATIIALIWANSPWAQSYHDFWHTPVTLGLGAFTSKQDIHFWINDGLMVFFFLVVGLEIKRELLVGELSSPRQAALPIVAALGGILVPALIYFMFNPPGTPFKKGWGIPTVTDIAFAIGVLTVLGSRVPLGLKVFLTALAIVDDLAAIFLIAVFYSGGLQMYPLLMVLGIMMALFVINRAGVDKPLVYMSIGVLLWLLVMQSGLHATISGVMLAFMIPARGKIDPAAFHQDGQMLLERFHRAGVPRDKSVILTNPEHQASVQELESLCESVQPPLQKLEHALHPWTSFIILPLFAMANAGVHINPSGILETLAHPITMGVVLGLFVGKQVGITSFAWLAVRLGLAELPLGVRWSSIYGAAILGGIGFTMSLFVSVLAFSDPSMVDNAKIGILIASVFSAVVGALVVQWTISRAKRTSESHS